MQASGYATKDEASLLLFGRATDSAYTAKPTFIRLASGRAGLPGRRAGGPRGSNVHRGSVSAIVTPTPPGGPGITAAAGAVHRTDGDGNSADAAAGVQPEGTLGEGQVEAVADGGSESGGVSAPLAVPMAPRASECWDPDQPVAAVRSMSPKESIFFPQPLSASPPGSSGGVGGSAGLGDGGAAGLLEAAGEVSMAELRVSETEQGAREPEPQAPQPAEAAPQIDPFDAMFKRRGANHHAGGSNPASKESSAASLIGDASKQFATTPPQQAQQQQPQPSELRHGAAGDRSVKLSDAARVGDGPGPSPLAQRQRSRRLSGLLPSLLSNDASAPAFLPDALHPEWLPDDSWLRLKDLGKLQPYNRVLPALLEDPAGVEALRRYFEQLGTLEGPPPAMRPRAAGGQPGAGGAAAAAAAAADPLEPTHPRIAELNTFQRLLLVRCLQPRGFVPAAQAAVREYLGPSCLANEQLLDFEAIFAVTESSMPIVLISSSDHTLPFLQQFADSRGISVIHMAVGRGQGAATDRLLRAAVGQDRWVILENAHLAGDWMPSLCRLVQALPTLRPHAAFRLWMTTVPARDFPDVILQSSLKLVMDPPRGLKANLLQVMSQLPVEVASNSRFAQQSLPSYGGGLGGRGAGGTEPGGAGGADPRDEVIGRKVTILSPDYKQLLLRLCLFHAVLTERQQYRALGWRRPYDFTAADMLSCVQQVMALVHGGAPPPHVDDVLPGLQHVAGQCLYGGKVTHDWDRRLLGCLLAQQLLPHEPSRAAAAVDTLFPEKLAACGSDLAVVTKELRGLAIPRDDPRLVGLSPGASAVRAGQYTRHVLDTLKRVQLLQSSGEDAELAKPLQLALSMCQDLLKQLPLQPLPGVRSGWVAMVEAEEKERQGAGPGRGVGPEGSRGKSAAAAARGAAGAGGGKGGEGGVAQPQQPALPARAAAAMAAAYASAHHVPRFKAVKMTEAMSPGAVERWEAMHPVLKAAMVQVGGGCRRTGSYQRASGL